LVAAREGALWAVIATGTVQLQVLGAFAFGAKCRVGALAELRRADVANVASLRVALLVIPIRTLRFAPKVRSQILEVLALCAQSSSLAETAVLWANIASPAHWLIAGRIEAFRAIFFAGGIGSQEKGFLAYIAVPLVGAELAADLTGHACALMPGRVPSHGVVANRTFSHA
jgi:hypothetical protein